MSIQTDARATGPRPEGTLEVFLLGGFAVLADARPVEKSQWTRHSAAQLVKLLALQPANTLHREQVLDALWPDLDVEPASKALNKAIHAARRALEPGLDSGARSRFLHTTLSTVTLAAPVRLWVDADAFVARMTSALGAGTREAFELAKDLYRGDLLPEDLYAEWASAPRALLRDRYLELLKAYGHFCAVRADWPRAILLFQELVEADPANEDAHRALMHLYALSGNRDHSFRQFGRCRAMLKEHLGIRPDRQTIELYERILSGAVEAAPPSGAAPADGERAEASPGELPRYLTSFVGRAAEVEEVSMLLESAGLVTLTGPGGIGKTRLSVVVARAAVSRFRDGVRFVELTGLREPGFVDEAFAGALGVREKPGRPLRASLLAFLQSKEILLVIDGAEHVIGATAALVDEMLRACPGVTVLFTGREVLYLPGERVYAVPGFALPDPHDAREASEADCVALFADRARAVVPAFALTERSTPLVAALCAALEGIPLAIELAAARLMALSLEQILERLADRRLLDLGSRGGLARHQTLRATIDWSHELLSEEERLLFRRVSPLHGGWTLAAAEAACPEIAGADEAVLEATAGLVRKSLAVASDQDAEVRYRMLDTVRVYAGEKLREAVEWEEAAARLRGWYRALAEEAEAELKGPRQEAMLARLDREHENIRAMLRVPPAGEGDDANLRICVGLMRFWTVRGHWTEGQALLEEAAAAAADAPPTALRAQALYSAGTLARLRNDFGRAGDLLRASLADWSALGNPAGEATAINQLGVVALAEGDTVAAERHAREALERYRAAGDRFGGALVLIQLANLCVGRGEYAEAKRFLSEAIDVFAAAGDKLNIGIVLYSLGDIAQREGDASRAEALFRESLETTTRLEYKLLQALCSTALGYIALGRGERKEAARLLADGLRLSTEINEPEILANAVDGLAGVSAARGDLKRAVMLGEMAAAVRRQAGLEPDEALSPVTAPLLEAARAGLSSAEIEEATAAARAPGFDALKSRLASLTRTN